MTSSLKPIRFAAIGLEHRHIYGQAGNMMNTGAEFVCWWTDGNPGTLDGFDKRFPGVPRVENRQSLLDDESIDLVLIAAIPSDRASLAIEAMVHGKDVMVDKPGCTSLEQLDAIKACVEKTGRIWSVNFSERFEVPCVTKAAELIQQGEIGQVINTVGLGPHRLNRPTRPDWFFDKSKYGGILCDIASHQIAQFLYFTDSVDAEITMASTANYANPQDPGLEDFGEVSIRSDKAHGYIRIDWYTPDALPTWGDGRLTILGTEGYIELRKYVDVARNKNRDNLILVNGSRLEHIDCANAGLPYFQNLIDDIRNRTETAMPQSYCFKSMELALVAQAMANQT